MTFASVPWSLPECRLLARNGGVCPAPGRKSMAEEAGFEPASPCGPAVFKAAERGEARQSADTRRKKIAAMGDAPPPGLHCLSPRFAGRELRWSYADRG